MFYVSDLRRHYVVIPTLGLGYGRIPKVANSTLKRLMARAAGLEQEFDGGITSRDRDWRAKAPLAYFLTAAEARRRFPEIILFSIVRDPLSRLESCYRSKVLRPERVMKSLRREGLLKTSTFPEFVEHVARRSDWRSNIHYRSQSHILRGQGGLAPDFIGRFETIRRDLERFSDFAQARGLSPLPPLPRRPTRAADEPEAGTLFNGDKALIALARHRYARDIDLFYSGRSLPGE